MKFYWILYECERNTWRKDGTFTRSALMKNIQIITTEHPLRWQIEASKKHEPRREYPGGVESESYIILNWKELSEDEYNEFKDLIE